MMRTSVRLMALVAMAAIAASGCFKSSTSQASSESSSNSSSSVSSCSPSEDEEESAYERDVRDYTVAHATSTHDLARFQQDLTDIAAGYGISDWEDDRTTHIAVGRGLAGSGLDASEADVLTTALVRADPTRTRWVLGAYHVTRPK